MPKSIFKLCLGFGAIFLISSNSFGAIDRAFAPLGKKHKYVENGTIIGGEAGTIHTLINLRRIQSAKDKIERLVFDLGDEKGRPLKSRVSYFQVTLDKPNNRVVIDLTQMIASGVNQQKLNEMFVRSDFVKAARINFDPVDSTITLQLTLKKEVLVEAFKLSAKDRPSRIALDLKEKI